VTRQHSGHAVASAAPKEYLQYVPDSAAFRQHTIFDGPYQIATYTANQSILLDKNPAWNQASDPVRHQYVDHISIAEGQDAGPVQQQIQAGTADLEWDTTVPTPNISALQASKDSGLGLYPRWTPTRTWCSTCRARPPTGRS
jgi:ABC-type transport system substrate-binding protein